MADLMDKLEKFYAERPNEFSIFSLSKLILTRLKSDRDFFMSFEGNRGAGKSNALILLMLVMSRYAGKWQNTLTGEIKNVLPRSHKLPSYWKHIQCSFSFHNNLSFLDESQKLQDKFNIIDRYMPFGIDEGSKNLHKYNWQDKVQQKLIQLSDSVEKDADIVYYAGDILKQDTIENMFLKYGKEPKNLKVYTIDDNFNVLLKPLKYILQKPLRKKMYEVKTSFNKKTIITEDHSLFILKNGKPVAVPTAQIKKDDIVFVPLRIPSITNVIKNNDEMEFFGSWIADGSYNNGENNIATGVSLSGHEHEDKMRKVANLWKCNMAIEKNKVDMYMNSTAFARYMKELGFQGISSTKLIPDWVFNTTIENKMSFLKGLFTGDGSISSDAISDYSSINKQLTKQIQILCNMCGLPSTMYKDSTPNSYVTEHKIYSNNTHNYCLSISSNFSYITKKLFHPSKTNYKILENHKPQRKRLGYIINDTFCAKVQSIKEVDYKGYVYDFEVEDIHRFIANGILHENTERYQNKAFFICIPNFKELTTAFRSDRINMRIFLVIRHTKKGICEAVISSKDESRWTDDPWHIDENAKKFEWLLRKYPVSRRTWEHTLRAERKLTGYLSSISFPNLKEFSPRLWEIYYKHKTINAQRELSPTEKKDSKQLQRYKFAIKQMIAFLKSRYKISWNDLGKLTKLSGTSVSRIWQEQLDIEGEYRMINDAKNMKLETQQEDTATEHPEE